MSLLCLVLSLTYLDRTDVARLNQSCMEYARTNTRYSVKMSYLQKGRTGPVCSTICTVDAVSCRICRVSSGIKIHIYANDTGCSIAVSDGVICYNCNLNNVIYKPSDHIACASRLSFQYNDPLSTLHAMSLGVKMPLIKFDSKQNKTGGFILQPGYLTIFAELSTEAKETEQNAKTFDLELRKVLDTHTVITKEYSSANAVQKCLAALLSTSAEKGVLQVGDLWLLSRERNVCIPGIAKLAQCKAVLCGIENYLGCLSFNFEMQGDERITVLQWHDSPIVLDSIKHMALSDSIKHGVRMIDIYDPGSRTKYVYIVCDNTILIVPNMDTTSKRLHDIINIFELPKTKR